MILFLSVVFFISGFSALVFESIWFQLAGITFGNSTWAASIILCSFMGGLALGNTIAVVFGNRIKKPVKAYAIAEMVIAVTGLSLVFIIPILTTILVPIMQPLLDQPVLLNLLRGIASILLMLLPTTAMGFTLPILVKALYSYDTNFGKILGVLYGWNTLGATIGVLISEIFLVKTFGLQGAGAIASLCNILAAVTVILVANNKITTDSGLEKVKLFSKLNFRIIRLLLGSFICGFILLALEVIWFRFIVLFFHGHSWNFAIMLAVVLAGISIGGFLASKLFKFSPNAHKLITDIIFINGMMVIILYQNFGQILTAFIHQNLKIQIILSSLFLMFPVSLLSGMIFTMLGKILHKEIKSETISSGLLTFSNTIGAMFGSISSGLLFIPHIGIENAYFLFAIMYGIVGILIFNKDLLKNGNKKNLSANQIGTITTLVCLILLLTFFPFGLMKKYYLEIPIHRFKEKGLKRTALIEGSINTVQYLEKKILDTPYYSDLVTNSYMMSSTQLKSKRYTKLFVYLPMSLLPKDVSRALLICIGCGTTANTLSEIKNFKNIDMVDISREIIDLAKTHFSNNNYIYDKRTNIYIEDGRFFLLTRDRKYDLITAEPPPPKSQGVVNLYTQEYFELMYKRLKKGGVVSYWLPVFLLEVSETQAILKAFCNVFDNCTLWTTSGLQWMIVGTRENFKKPSYKNFSKLWQIPAIKKQLQSIGVCSPQEMASLFIADENKLQKWCKNITALRDNYPKQLSPVYADKKKIVPKYFKFMDPYVARDHFKKSKIIDKILPDKLKKEALKYFPVRNAINEILEREEETIPLIHYCLNDPLLNNYILWTLYSDDYAQDIIEKKLKNKTQCDLSLIWSHLVAKAVQERNYLLADKYLVAYKEKAIKFYGKNYYYKLRIYLLFQTGNKNRARNLILKYINLNKKRIKEASREMKGYWFWLQDNCKVKK